MGNDLNKYMHILLEDPSHGAESFEDCTGWIEDDDAPSTHGRQMQHFQRLRQLEFARLRRARCRGSWLGTREMIQGLVYAGAVLSEHHLLPKYWNVTKGTLSESWREALICFVFANALVPLGAELRLAQLKVHRTWNQMWTTLRLGPADSGSVASDSADDSDSDFTFSRDYEPSFSRDYEPLHHTDVHARQITYTRDGKLMSSVYGPCISSYAELENTMFIISGRSKWVFATVNLTISLVVLCAGYSTWREPGTVSVMKIMANVFLLACWFPFLIAFVRISSYTDIQFHDLVRNHVLGLHVANEDELNLMSIHAASALQYMTLHPVGWRAFDALVDWKKMSVLMCSAAGNLLAQVFFKR